MKIKIIECFANGKQFGNITSNSIHEVIKIDSMKGTKRGKIRNIPRYWVMGVGEPIALLDGEFEILEEEFLGKIL